MASLEEGELEDGELLSSDEEPDQGDSKQHKVCNYPIGTLHLGNCITAIFGRAACAIFSNMAPVYMCMCVLSARNVLTVFRVLLHLSLINFLA